MVFIIWKGSGFLTLACVFIGLFFSMIFLQPYTPGYRGLTFLIATILNYFVAQVPGHLFFINVRVWTFIYLGLTIYGYFFFE